MNFVTPFCQCNRKGRCEALHVAEQFGIPCKTIAVTDEFFALIRHPRYGYGSGMNPCLDCRIVMFRKARQRMEDTGADFVFTGEVVDERSMSQRRDAMRIIERESGLAGRLLRPLCAGLLSPTIPEQAGVVDRERLLDISDRSRKPQPAHLEPSATVRDKRRRQAGLMRPSRIGSNRQRLNGGCPHHGSRRLL